MITLKEIQQAHTLIAPYIKRTPTERSETLSRHLGANVYLKYELFQKTGSFKPRGAFNQMLRLNPEQKARGAVAVSGGNFAQGVAYAGNVLGIKTRILMPAVTPKNYIEATQGYGAEVELLPDISVAFKRADEYKNQGLNFLHPFDDPFAMQGYGTVGLELFADVPQVTDVVVSVGGGGLMTGNTVAIKGLKPSVHVWSVETEGADALDQALKAGKVVNVQPTSLARTLGAPYAAADALITVQTQVARHILVSDREAFTAQTLLLERAKVLTELATSCTLAAAEKIRDQFSKDSHVVLILCGGNVSLDNLAEYKAKFG